MIVMVREAEFDLIDGNSLECYHLLKREKQSETL